ncbi:universal stress protein [Streptomyces sp. KM273126]|uniref:universal stress protein n=1 Tax=Streptomyces sp. KM273126 TaxID=2545247 RepID=UPI0014043234|nr:universal stress protein [Streptomyces sp. KM273126]MBA2806906.1 universal stress protein [Streptomyces sp. KM273126]
MTEPIVVGVDGSGRSLRALLWAAQEASLHHRPLRIVHVLPFEPAPVPEPRIVSEATAIATQAHPELEVTSAESVGTPAAAFLSESERAHTVTLGAKGRGGFGTVMLGSVALQVVGHAASPVVVVNHVPLGQGRITVGVDGSAHSQAALEYAFKEASLRSTQLQALYAWSPPGGPAPVSPAQDEADAEYRQALQEWLAPLRHEYPDVEVVEELAHESPVLALARASDRSDLLVVGSRGRGGFRGLALGSVSHALLQYSMCPMAVIRPHTQPAPS